ncbi:MarR family winged helix-turn-helix transcriptional regulator [Paenibacillus sp. CAA11]|uniref:MarR family winged helix-turn-helix transcriptional regulator n=1 Tax=Paenibacillus sp. CAA11 TaxID=1532905 RepID=UPI001F1A98B8|nr:MarR family transcriptional regulator [Paenibacillus sp. CAA11]
MEGSPILDQLLSINKQIAAKFERCAGISPSRLQILHLLYLVEEMSQASLQKEIGIDGAAVTRHLKQLEADGTVTRRTNPEDNRITLVKLTEFGRSNIARYKQEKEQFVSRMLEGFNDAELQMLSGLMQRLNYNLSQV